MKARLTIISIAVLLVSGMAAASPQMNELTVEKNISTVAGTTDTSVVTFRYNGHKSGSALDPLAIGVEIGDEQEITSEMFNITSTLIVDTEDSSPFSGQYNLRCGGEYSDIAGDWEISEYYGNSMYEYNANNQWFCFPEKTFGVLPVNTNYESELRVNITPHYAMEPKTYDINYTFHSFEGLPDTDPRGKTDENGSLVFEDLGLRIESASGSEFSVVTYSDIFVDSKMPAGEDNKLFYMRINSIDDKPYSIEMNYSQEKVDTEGLEDPRLYRCMIIDDDCIWIDEPNQVSGNGSIEANLTKSGLYGLFSSEKDESENNDNSDSDTDNSDSTGSNSGSTSPGSSSSSSSNVVIDHSEDDGQDEQESSENQSSEEQNETESEEIPHNITLEMAERVAPGEPVEVTALVDGESTEGVEIFLNGQLQGTTGEDGTLTFTPRGEGTLSVAAAYDNSFNSSSLEVTEEAAKSNGITGAVVESAPVYGVVLLIAAVVGLVYWRREEVVSSLKARLDYVRS